MAVDTLPIVEEKPVVKEQQIKPKQTKAQTEAQAAQQRKMLPLEQRQNQFRDMMLERGVSAFSTWEKELPKIVFDPRFLLLMQRERKQCFERFVRTRAEEERQERKNKLKEKKENFKDLLKTAKVTPK